MKVIAELGNTHEGSVGLAKCMIKSAAECGADVVKLQTHIFEAESLDNAPNPPYFNGESRKEYFKRTAFNREQYIELIAYSREIGVELVSSPFSVEAVHFLLGLGMTMIKIPSGEVSNDFLLNAVAGYEVDVILSSGMSSFDELDHAVELLTEGNIRSLSLLQCTSEYPCPAEKVGLENMAIFKERYGVDVGFSDHTLSESIPAIAAYAGASIIEKHFTLSKLAYGSDAKNSLEPEAFARMVGHIRDAQVLLVHTLGKSTCSENILNMKRVFEKSLVYTDSFVEGHVLEYRDFAAKKPGDGLPVREYIKLLGKKITSNVFKDQKVRLEDVEC